ncbi:hypothetical protein APASM_4619 [Actinosynnema pretiosum subsp. pretiosum]|nr:hypothetical protein APASM_4619 [Actinosynnema pretiosum subsp. pretiosum]
MQQHAQPFSTGRDPNTAYFRDCGIPLDREDRNCPEWIFEPLDQSWVPPDYAPRRRAPSTPWLLSSRDTRSGRSDDVTGSAQRILWTPGGQVTKLSANSCGQRISSPERRNAG